LIANRIYHLFHDNHAANNDDWCISVLLTQLPIALPPSRRQSDLFTFLQGDAGLGAHAPEGFNQNNAYFLEITNSLETFRSLTERIKWLRTNDLWTIALNERHMNNFSTNDVLGLGFSSSSYYSSYSVSTSTSALDDMTGNHASKMSQLWSGLTGFLSSCLSIRKPAQKYYKKLESKLD